MAHISNSSACEGCGHCCSAFTLNTSISTIRQTASKRNDKRLLQWVTVDIEPHPDQATAGVGIITSEVLDYGETIYRCTLLDPETKLCTDYENRPDICRSFPSYIANDETGKHPGTIYESCNLYDELARENVKPQIKTVASVNKEQGQ